MPANQFSVHKLPLKGAAIIKPPIFTDHRGHFLVPFNREALHDHGITADFFQDNQSLSKFAGTLRGLHIQLPANPQAKLVRVAQGSILDVMVDARRESPTFGQHCTAHLSATTGEQAFVPRGFLHGFITREPDTIVIYKVDNIYSPGDEISVKWDDIDLGIDWELGETRPVMSEKDEAGVSWLDFVSRV